jgi:hypothetical protein
LGTGGETFVLDMGEPVKIVDLARDLIRLSGLKEGTDIDIKFTGLIEGEKMHEELFYVHEHAIRSKHEKIFVCLNGHTAMNNIEGDEAAADVLIGKKTKEAARATERQREAFMLDIDLLLSAARAADAESTNILLKKIIPEYSNPALEKQNGGIMRRLAAPDDSMLPGVGVEKEKDIIITFTHGHSSADMPDRLPTAKPQK